MPSLRSPKYAKYTSGGAQSSPRESLRNPVEPRYDPSTSQGRSFLPVADSNPSGRPRRLTAPQPSADDPFLILANDDDPAFNAKQAGTRPSRRKSVTASNTNAHRAAPPPIDTSATYRSGTSANARREPLTASEEDARRRPKWLQNLPQSSPLSAHYRARLRGSESPAYSNEDSPRPASNVSRQSVSRQGNGDAARQQHEQRKSSMLYQSTTPSQLRHRNNRPADFAYSTPETNEGVGNAPRERKHPESQRSQSQTDGVESEASTNAASTVWDDLDDLKTRLRKLEDSGRRSRMHSGRVTTFETGERPRTGTTQATGSTSEHGSSGGDYLSPTGGPFARRGSASAELHPLLRSALAKAKPSTNHGMYQALESSTSDALQLASAVRTDFPGSHLYGSPDSDEDPAQTQKRVVRKADNLCRSLTELCIAICDTNNRTSAMANVSTGSAARPGSRDKEHQQVNGTVNSDSPLTLLDQRRKLMERAYQLSSRMSSRQSSRMYERSDSCQAGLPTTRQSSAFQAGAAADSSIEPRSLNRAFITGYQQTHAMDAASTQYRQRPQHRLNHHVSISSNEAQNSNASTNENSSDVGQDQSSSSEGNDTATARHSGTNGQVASTRFSSTLDTRPRHTKESTNDSTATLRAPSRSQTNPSVTEMRHSPRDLRMSRDYTNRHPLPENNHLAPSLRHALSGTQSNYSSNSVATARVANDRDRDADPALLRPAKPERGYITVSPSPSPSQTNIPSQRRSTVSGSRIASPTGTARDGAESTGRHSSLSGNLAERLEQKRQQRGVASAGQLKGTAAEVSPSIGASRTSTPGNMKGVANAAVNGVGPTDPKRRDSEVKARGAPKGYPYDYREAEKAPKEKEGRKRTSLIGLLGAERRKGRSGSVKGMHAVAE